MAGAFEDGRQDPGAFRWSDYVNPYQTPPQQLSDLANPLRWPAMAVEGIQTAVETVPRMLQPGYDYSNTRQAAEDAFNVAGVVGAGSLLGTAAKPANAVGTFGGKLGGAAGDLDMSQAARMARAKEMGFDTDRVWFRGDDDKITAYETQRPSKRWTSFSEHDVTTQGVNFSPSAEDAASYGKNVGEFYLRPGRMLTDPDAIPLSSRSSPDEFEAVNRLRNDIEYILEPMMYEVADGVKAIDTNGGLANVVIDPDGDWITKVFGGYMDWSYMDNPEVVKRMRERGYDSTMVAEPNDMSGESIFLIDPSNIRSVNAAFDPAKADSANLLASRGVPVGAFGVPREEPIQDPDREIY